MAQKINGKMRTACLFLLLVTFVSIIGQNRCRIMCYNVENLFDYKNDSLTNDDEFTLSGKRGWNYQKYTTKLARISKVITALGEGTPPMLVGLCEIENEKVLNDLTKYAPLKSMNYRFKHFESPDKRGVDVGLLYQKTLFSPFHAEPLSVNFQKQPLLTTRDILYVAGTFLGKDTLHIFVCHFPSRLGGELESEHKRCSAAKVLKRKTDSIFSSQPNANIIIMGDFNDYPTNKSLTETLNAQAPQKETEENKLYNLFYQYNDSANIGTHKHGSEWGVLDQIIVSGHLLNEKSHIRTSEKNARIFHAPFLLETDKKFLYQKPFRTYAGFKYNNGFSDHLPIYIDLNYGL